MDLVKQNKYSYHYDDPQCFRMIEKTIYSFMMDLNRDFSRETVYLCIGTDRATGDCLGPLVGTRLKSLLASANVFGTLEQPVHATNLDEYLEEISNNYDNPLLVAIDACLGNSNRIGFINVEKGSLKPGTALKKNLPEVGDFHVSGVVNVGGFLEHMVLQNTRLHTVYKMAEVIAKSLCMAHYEVIHKQAILSPQDQVKTSSEPL
ncbi:MAG: spore protease YyaC [Syntrophomonas sp.]